MQKYPTASLAIALLAAILSNLAVAAESAAVIDIGNEQLATQWVPPGFELLNEPQVTVIDLFYGGEYLASTLARFTQTQIWLLDSDGITALLQNVRDPGAVNLQLQEEFSTNTGAICHSDFQVDCGILDPEAIELIFDRSNLRADLFINSELLVAGKLLQNRFLPDSSASFSLFSDSTVFFSGASQEATSFNVANTTRLALAESRLLFRNNFTDEQGLTIDTLALQKEHQGKDFQLGLFRGNSSNFRFMNSEQFFGASMASSVLTRIDLDQSLGTEIEMFLNTRSRVDIYRDNRLLGGAYYDVGNHIINTAILPPGSYDIELRITDSNGVVTTEERYFSKTSKLPPDDQSIYFVQVGRLADRESEGSIPKFDSPIIRAGYSKRFTQTVGAEFGVSATPDSTMLETGLFKLGRDYEIQANLAFEDNGAVATDVNVRWDRDWIRLNLNSRKIWSGDSDLQLGESRVQNSVSVDVPSKWGSFGLFSRTNRRGEEESSKNYGLRWRSNSFSTRGGNLSASLEFSRNDNDLLALFTVNYRFNGGRSQHTFTPRYSYESYSAGLRQTQFQGSQVSSWQSGNNDQNRFTLRADHDTQSSIEARFENSRSIGDTDLSARYDVNGRQLEYSGRLSTSFGYTREATGFGGRPQGESAFIIVVDGAPKTSEFEVIINGSARGKTVSGKKLLVPVAPYETYRIELNPLGNSIINLDNHSYRKTVYPGNVVTLNWSAQIIKIIFGRVTDEAGDPIGGALIRNVHGFGVTDDRGFFQVEINQSTKSLMIQKGTEVCEADFENNEALKEINFLGTLTCKSLDDSSGRDVPETSELPELLGTTSPAVTGDHIEVPAIDTVSTPTLIDALLAAVETSVEDSGQDAVVNSEIQPDLPQITQKLITTKVIATTAGLTADTPNFSVITEIPAAESSIDAELTGAEVTEQNGAFAAVEDSRDELEDGRAQNESSSLAIPQRDQLAMSTEMEQELIAFPQRTVSTEPDYSAIQANQDVVQPTDKLQNFLVEETDSLSQREISKAASAELRLSTDSSYVAFAISDQSGIESHADYISAELAKGPRGSGRPTSQSCSSEARASLHVSRSLGSVVSCKKSIRREWRLIVSSRDNQADLPLFATRTPNYFSDYLRRDRGSTRG